MILINRKDLRKIQLVKLKAGSVFRESSGAIDYIVSDQVRIFEKTTRLCVALHDGCCYSFNNDIIVETPVKAELTIEY